MALEMSVFGISEMDLCHEKARMERDLYIARQLQQSMLPKVLNQNGLAEQFLYAKPHFSSADLLISGFYLSCDALGGDLYDIFQINENEHLLCVIDVSGHGVAASFITAIIKASMYQIFQETQNPGEILDHLNRELIRIVKTGDYATAWMGKYNRQTKELTYSVAGHPHPVHYQAKANECATLKGKGLPLGWVEGMAFEESTITLHPGDRFCVYTDVATEMVNDADEMFGEDALCKTLLETAESGEHQTLDELVMRLSDHSNAAPINDDVSMLLLEVY